MAATEGTLLPPGRWPLLCGVQNEEEQAGRSHRNFKLQFLVVPGMQN